MSTDREKALEFNKEVIKVHKQIALLYKELEFETDNRLITGVIEWISMKASLHAHMFTMIDIYATQVDALIPDELRQTISETIKEHIKLENLIIKTIKDIIPDIKDEKIKRFIKFILTDLRRDSRMLRSFSKNLLVEETLTMDNIWVQLWLEDIEDWEE